jgi:TetR/AcrR family transcriptional repressor of mexJK operon
MVVQIFTMTDHIKRGRGRPRNLENRSALLAAGKALLLDHGFGVKVDTIAAKAGVAKATFYNYFADKEAFVEAVLLNESDRTITDEQFDAASEKPLREALTEFGVRYLAFANERQLIKWDRLIASTNDVYPELAERMFAAGPGRGYNLLTRILVHGMEAGQLRSCDPAQAAGDIVGLWHGLVVLQINLRARAPMSDEEIVQRARRGVELFFQLYES